MPTTELTVTGRETITPDRVRLWFSGDLSAFAESRFTDRYVKIVFPRPGVDYPHLDVKALRGTIPAADLPATRTFTALFPDVDAGTLAMDFVLHAGVGGLAADWAASAEAGDTILVNGPGGAYAPDPDAGWHLLVGDESAAPAIIAALDVLPAEAVVRCVLLVEDAAHEWEVPVGPNGTVTWVHRAEDPAKDSLLRAIRSLDWPGADVHAFVHGEAEETMLHVRPYLLKDRGVARERLSISGYWRRGQADEDYRAWKKTELAGAIGD